MVAVVALTEPRPNAHELTYVLTFSEPPSEEEDGEPATCLADDSLSDADLLAAIGRELGRVPAMADAALQAALAAVGAPTPVQEHVTAAKAGARSQALVALHSKRQLDALEEKEARGRPDTERHIFEIRRWIASNGNSNQGYLGTDAADDSAAPTPMSVLGDDSAAARAKEGSKLPIPECGLFFTSRTSGTATNATGQGFYAAVAAACADRYLCHVRYGVNFVVTHRVIESFARVDFSRETGVTPDWTTPVSYTHLTLPTIYSV